MTFTMQQSACEDGQMVEICEGSHVYLSEGYQYKEWDELTPEQQKALVSVRDILSGCFEKSMASPVETAILP